MGGGGGLSGVGVLVGVLVGTGGGGFAGVGVLVGVGVDGSAVAVSVIRSSGAATAGPARIGARPRPIRIRPTTKSSARAGAAVIRTPRKTVGSLRVLPFLVDLYPITLFLSFK
jgi:hypothetical protein